MLSAVVGVLEDIARYALAHPDLAAKLAGELADLLRGNDEPSLEAQRGMAEGLARMRSSVATTAMMRERKAADGV